MSRKLSNDEWEEFVTKYYDSNASMTINAFCKEHGISKQQFHYHKKRIKETKEADNSIFHEFKFTSEVNTDTKSFSSEKAIKITIGKINIDIPASETVLISTVIKELALNVKY